MNSFFKGKIVIEDGKLKQLEPDKQLEIKLNGKNYIFDNCSAVPGFTDSHGHIAMLGMHLKEISFNLAESSEECAVIASKQNILRGGWLFGQGWNQENWHSGKYPDKEILDSYFPDIPVYFRRVDGHAAWVNSKALAIAGINNNSPDPTGGEIVKDKKGKPTGLLIDNAMFLVFNKIPRYDKETLKEMIISGMNELAKSGLTEAHDMDVEPYTYEIWKEIPESLFPIRVHSYLKAHENEWQDIVTYLENKYYKTQGVKLYADGALGSHGALLKTSYFDKQNTMGLQLISQKSLIEKAIPALEKGLDIAVHAIGDKAVEIVAESYRELRPKGFSNILRIEHGQIISREDIELISNNDIVVSVQPSHCISDICGMVKKRLKPQTLSHSYPWKSLINAGITMPAGSDFPIEPHSPIDGIQAFCIRKPRNGGETFMPEERLSLGEAINAYTHSPRAAVNTENRRGSLKEGFDADITIIETNGGSLAKTNIEEFKIKATLCNGKFTYLNKK